MRPLPSGRPARQWVGAAELKRLRLWRARRPLAHPYRLSLGEVRYFDTVLAMVELGDGRLGWGDVTPLLGYGWEDAGAAWDWLAAAGPAWLGRPAHQVFQEAMEQAAGHPCGVTPLATALEWPRWARLAARAGSLPLVAGLDAPDPDGLAARAHALAREGYTCLKLKVGGELGCSAEALARLRAGWPAGVGLRVDANQGLSPDQARRLWRALDMPELQHLEQPFAAGDWDAAADFLAICAEARLCLDESVWTPEDLERGLALGGRVTVKLKLLKHGSLWSLAALARRVLAAGRGLVIGNGVQAEVGCLLEFALARRLGLNGALEMNGFTRLARPLMPGFPLAAVAGRAVHAGGAWAPPAGGPAGAEVIASLDSGA